MPIRPIDIRRKEFKNGFRGYDANQVDDFLDAVADEFERTYTENQRMREEVSSLRDRLQQFEDLEGSIRAALVHAEQASNDLRRAANQEAENVRQNAQREADFTIREAQTRSHQMLADSAARIERVQDSYEALQEAKRSFANDFRHLLKTYMDMMENMEVSSAREIEASLRERLDTESIAVVREAAAAQGEEPLAAQAGEEPDQPVSEPEVVEPEEEPTAFTVTGSEDAGATQNVEPEAGEEEFAATEVSPEHPETAVDEPPAEEQPTEVLRTEGPLSAEPEAEEPPEEAPAEEPAGEPSTAQGETVQESPVSEPEAADEVEREEPALAEESSSQEFFDRGEGEQGDSRIFRASRFLRRRE